MEDREKHRPKTDEDVEAHKKHTPVALRGDEAPTEEEGTDDDVELHRAKNQSSKL